ncbi:MAG: hypothetical protein AB7P03_08360 [Kofleriaceae bacterium]
MIRLVPVVTLAALVACGDNTPGARGLASGSRLKLAWYEYSDGTRQLEPGWYFDHERGERCTPLRWSDGSRYCTPAADDAVYIDSTCATARGRVPAGTAPAPYFVRYYHARGTPLPSRLTTVGSPAPAPPLRWQLHDGVCLGPYPVEDGFDYYEVGETLTSDAFVRVRRTQPQGADRLAVELDTSDDGLSVVAAIYDRDTREECIVTALAGASAVECVTGEVAVAGHYHDAQCSELEILTTSPEPPAVARHDAEETGCSSYYAVGEPTTAPPLYEWVNDLCQTVFVSGNPQLYLAGDPVALPTLDREYEMTQRRLARITRVHGAVRADDPMLYDAGLMTDCERRDDGSEIRCVPATAARVVTVFADQSCATAVEVALVPSGECDPPSRFASKDAAIYPVLAVSAPVYELTTSEQCRAYTPPVRMVIHAIGDPLPPSAFVSAKLEIDP